MKIYNIWEIFISNFEKKLIEPNKNEKNIMGD